MDSIPSHASGVEFIQGLTFGNPLPSKPSSVKKLSELGQCMSDICLGLNRHDLSCDKYIKVLNKLMEVKDLRGKKFIRFNHFFQCKSMAR